MMTVKEIREKLRVLFSSALTDEEKAALKAEQARLADAGMPPPADPKPMEMKTKDGKTLTCSGDLAEGCAMNMAGPDGQVDVAPDGEYILENGDKLTVASGIVTKIEKAQVAPEAPADMAAAVEQLGAKFSEHKSELEKAIELKFKAEKDVLLAKIAQMEKVQLSTLNALEKILNTPLDTIPFEEAKPRELTAAERYSLEHPIEDMK